MNKFNVYPYKPNQMRDLYKKGESINFLNQTYKIYDSPAKLHERLNIPIYVYFCKYDFENKEFIQKIVSIKKNIDDESIHNITPKIADVFSQEIINNPEQYLWIIYISKDT